jgi:uncharacterized protein (DUF58 family)
MIPKELLAALRTIEIHTARLANEQLSGTYASSFKGQGLAFREVRPYQQGDDVRTIDWNVSARMNEAFVKVFVEEREMTVMIAVDLSESGRFGTRRAQKAHVASEVAALLAFSAIRNNDRVGLLVGTNRLERVVAPKKGEKHVMRVVREILGFTPTLHETTAADEAGRRDAKGTPRIGVATDLKGMLEGLVGVARRRSIAFVVSDFLAEGYDRALSLAAAKHDVVPVVLLATFQDLESGEEILVDTSSPEVRAFYKSSMQKIRAARIALFRKRGLDSVEIDTGSSFVRPLRDLFARRARRMSR